MYGPENITGELAEDIELSWASVTRAAQIWNKIPNYNVKANAHDPSAALIVTHEQRQSASAVRLADDPSATLVVTHEQRRSAHEPSIDVQSNE